MMVGSCRLVAEKAGAVLFERQENGQELSVQQIYDQRPQESLEAG